MKKFYDYGSKHVSKQKKDRKGNKPKEANET